MPDLRKFKNIERKFEKIFKKITTHDLNEIDCEHKLNEQEILQQLIDHSGTSFLLGTYTKKGLENALKKYGIFDQLRRKGFKGLELDLKLDDPYKQIVRMYFDHTKDPDHLLIEIMFEEGIFKTDDKTELLGRKSFEVLIIDWIILQNPLARFTRERPKLPGQKYPGLGLGYEVLMLLILMARRLKKCGLLGFPQHYHNAKLYHPFFRFFDPKKEGFYLAVERDLQDYDFFDVAWAFALDCVKEINSGHYVKWRASELILPLAEELKNYFRLPSYKEEVERAKDTYKFEIDSSKLGWECLKNKRD